MLRIQVMFNAESNVLRTVLRATFSLLVYERLITHSGTIDGLYSFRNSPERLIVLQSSSQLQLIHHSLWLHASEKSF